MPHDHQVDVLHRRPDLYDPTVCLVLLPCRVYVWCCRAAVCLSGVVALPCVCLVLLLTGERGVLLPMALLVALVTPCWIGSEDGS